MNDESVREFARNYVKRGPGLICDERDGEGFDTPRAWQIRLEHAYFFEEERLKNGMWICYKFHLSDKGSGT